MKKEIIDVLFVMGELLSGTVRHFIDQWVPPFRPSAYRSCGLAWLAERLLQRNFYMGAVLVLDVCQNKNG